MAKIKDSMAQQGRGAPKTSRSVKTQKIWLLELRIRDLETWIDEIRENSKRQHFQPFLQKLRSDLSDFRLQLEQIQKIKSTASECGVVTDSINNEVSSEPLAQPTFKISASKRTKRSNLNEKAIQKLINQPVKR